MKNIFLFRTCLLVLLTLFGFFGYGQVLISGKVVDAETKAPLEGASVFAQNTTRGVITNKEGDYKIVLNNGGYELVISFTGYSSQTFNVQADENKQIDVELKKEDQSMSEVVITSSNEVPDGLEKYGKFFLKYFIGATPFSDSCTLQNPEVLKFLYYRRSDKLKVLATEPLLISNHSLGYNLRYEMDSFVYYYKNSVCSYRGNCLYTLLEGDTAQQALWEKNRQQAYYGSRLHFLRSYYDSTLKQDGFTVDMLSPTDSRKFMRLANPYDTSYYFYNDTTGNAELWFPQKASITYTRKAPEITYLQQNNLPLNVKMQISYVDLSDAILIKENGYFLDQRSWTAQGYWSWKNLADQLPYDYEPFNGTRE